MSNQPLSNLLTWAREEGGMSYISAHHQAALKIDHYHYHDS